MGDKLSKLYLRKTKPKISQGHQTPLIMIDYFGTTDLIEL